MRRSQSVSIRSSIAAVEARRPGTRLALVEHDRAHQRPLPQHRPGRVEVNDVDVRLGDPLEIIYQPEVVDRGAPLQQDADVEVARRRILARRAAEHRQHPDPVAPAQRVELARVRGGAQAGEALGGGGHAPIIPRGSALVRRQARRRRDRVTLPTSWPHPATPSRRRDAGLRRGAAASGRAGPHTPCDPSHLPSRVCEPGTLCTGTIGV